MPRQTIYALTICLTLLGLPGQASAQFLSCVQYLRSTTSFQLSGNAWSWWDDAARKSYKRGAEPQAGAVLVFKSAQRMHAGHVALVRRVEDPRLILIDHSNWAQRRQDKGKIALRVPVRDVSERNDWTKVQVWNEQARAFGNTYNTYGFVYHPDKPPTRDFPAQPSREDRRVLEAALDSMLMPGRRAPILVAQPILPMHALINDDLVAKSFASLMPFLLDPAPDEVPAETVQAEPKTETGNPIEALSTLFKSLCREVGCESSYPSNAGS